MKTAILKSESKFDRYTGWLENFGLSFEVLDHSESGDGIGKLEECSGIIFTGGVDIYPELYCDWDTPETKGTYNPERDGYELKLMGKAFERKIPMLCICRGMQLLNVFYRGSLIFDLEEMRGTNHRKVAPTQDRLHYINIYGGTMLHEILGLENAEVNSSHHQAVDRLGEGLIASSRSEDGIIESIEFADKTDKSFLIGIQWHPERFADFKNPVSKNIIERFIEEISKVKLQNV